MTEVFFSQTNNDVWKGQHTIVVHDANGNPHRANYLGESWNAGIFGKRPGTPNRQPPSPHTYEHVGTIREGILIPKPVKL